MRAWCCLWLLLVLLFFLLLCRCSCCGSPTALPKASENESQRRRIRSGFGSSDVTSWRRNVGGSAVVCVYVSLADCSVLTSESYRKSNCSVFVHTQSNQLIEWLALVKTQKNKYINIYESGASHNFIYSHCHRIRFIFNIVMKFLEWIKSPKVEVRKYFRKK